MLQLVFIIFSCTVFLSYLALVISFVIGWNNINEFFITKNTPVKPTISCIIPFRNEKENLTDLLRCLNNQSYPISNFEVIFVDDGSTDSSFEIVSELIKHRRNYSLITCIGEGKKNAISTGISKAKFDYIITTDADCILSTHWLKAISQYLSKYDPDLLIGPVVLNGMNNFFNQFQIIDFLSLVASGAGAVGINNPIMCNGANLIVKKEIIIEAQKSIHNSYPSGDDIFLLQYCKAKKKNIHFLKCKDAIVYSSTVNNLKQFFSQRVRWASKSKGYTDIFTLCVAWIVFITSILMLFAPIYTFINTLYGIVLLLLGLLKTMIDYYLLKKGADFFLKKLPFKKFALIQAVYPFYIVLTVIWAIFGKVNWKNRKL